MGFEAEGVALEIVGEMAVILRMIRGNRDLVDQMRRAATSIALNVAEGAERRGKDRPLHFSYAAGSARELRAALFVAEKWRYVDAEALRRVRGLIDRELAMLWRLTHPRSTNSAA